MSPQLAKYQSRRSGRRVATVATSSLLLLSVSTMLGSLSFVQGRVAAATAGDSKPEVEVIKKLIEQHEEALADFEAENQNLKDQSKFQDASAAHPDISVGTEDIKVTSDKVADGLEFSIEDKEGKEEDENEDDEEADYEAESNGKELDGFEAFDAEGDEDTEESQDDDEDLEDFEIVEDEDPFSIELFEEGTDVVDDIYQGLGCGSLMFDRPIPSPEDWNLLRSTYIESIGKDKATIQDKYLELGSNSFLVPVKVDHSEGKGRGLFAVEHIAKGTKIYQCHEHTAYFETGKQYRNYLQKLPADMACDVIEWTYVEYKDAVAKTGLRIGLDLDEISLANGGSDMDEVNIDTKYVATRDIAAGEEILEDYSAFVVENGWGHFGM